MHNSFSYNCLFQFSACFEQPSAHHQESQLYQYDLGYVSLYVGDRVVRRFRWNWSDASKPAYHAVTYIEWHIPEVVLIQLTLMMMSTWLLETYREMK